MTSRIADDWVMGWLVMGMMERLTIQWAVLISSHSQLINKPSSHAQLSHLWSTNQLTCHPTMGSCFRFIEAHTGTDQFPVIIPINHLTFPHLGLSSHILLFFLSFVPTDDQVAFHTIVLTPVSVPIILMALIFVPTQPTLIYFLSG